MATIRSYIHNMSVELRLKPLETALYIGFSGQGITPLKLESCVYFCVPWHVLVSQDEVCSLLYTLSQNCILDERF